MPARVCMRRATRRKRASRPPPRRPPGLAEPPRPLPSGLPRGSCFAPPQRSRGGGKGLPATAGLRGPKGCGPQGEQRPSRRGGVSQCSRPTGRAAPAERRQRSPKQRREPAGQQPRQRSRGQASHGPRRGTAPPGQPLRGRRLGAPAEGPLKRRAGGFAPPSRPRPGGGAPGRRAVQQPGARSRLGRPRHRLPTFSRGGG